MSAISFRLPEEIESRLSEEARLEGRPRSEVVREAIVDYINRRERDRYMARMVEAARALAEDPAARSEAEELADEAVATGNEALAIAEGRESDESRADESGQTWWR